MQLVKCIRCGRPFHSDTHRTCEPCRVKKQLHYLINRRRALGYSRKWRQEHAEYIAAYRRENKERLAELSSKWAHANKDYVAEYNKRYYLAHKERILEQRRIWYLANRERLAEKRAEKRQAAKKAKRTKRI